MREPKKKKEKKKNEAEMPMAKQIFTYFFSCSLGRLALRHRSPKMYLCLLVCGVRVCDRRYIFCFLYLLQLLPIIRFLRNSNGFEMIV